MLVIRNMADGSKLQTSNVVFQTEMLMKYESRVEYEVQGMGQQMSKALSSHRQKERHQAETYFFSCTFQQVVCPRSPSLADFTRNAGVKKRFSPLVTQERNCLPSSW